MGLARTIRAEDRHAVAKPDFVTEWLHQPGQLELLGDDGTLGGASSLESHVHVLFQRDGLGRPGFEELCQACLGRVVAVGHVGTEGRLVLVHVHQLLELGVFLVPALAQLLEALIAFAAGLDVGTERATMDPRGSPGMPRLQRDDPACGIVEQFAVVADEQDRLG
ncbi:hypothetical protein B879_04250 [Cecembia lonarensis LW9]|uniref:Uncharacterized protein n=1 Tax=Cecembia lonarensis (strain CCUG 58316 / KCTC 22772 / LW9) TaxID=1225176 RepID=K1L542_CECL9|nr:hypothetical protein B879_04250 [Cecembia lonarensis LW9]